MQNLFFEASTTINLPQESEKPLLCCKSSQDSISKLGDTRVFLNKEKRVSMNVLFSSLRRDFAVLLQVTAPGTEYQRCCSKWLNICWSQGKRKNNKKREHCSRQGHKLVNELDLKPQQKNSIYHGWEENTTFAKYTEELQLKQEDALNCSRE